LSPYWLALSTSLDIPAIGNARSCDSPYLSGRAQHAINLKNAFEIRRAAQPLPRPFPGLPASSARPLWAPSPSSACEDRRARASAGGRGGPVILLTPHFVGLEAPLFRHLDGLPVLRCTRGRRSAVSSGSCTSGEPGWRAPLSRQASVRKALRAIASARSILSPDLDSAPARGVRPFFACRRDRDRTVVYCALHRCGASCVRTRMLPRQRHVARLYRRGAASRRRRPGRRARLMLSSRSACSRCRAVFWLHKRFKTRPEEEARFY